MSALTAGTLLGIGNPLLDISAAVDAEMLTRFGLEPSNAILAEEKHMAIFDELKAKDDVAYLAGGATQNSTRVAGWMVADSPNAARFIGCIGKDADGEMLKKSATDAGVDVHYLEQDKVPTGTCACLINNSDRSLVAFLSAANEYKIEHFQTEAIQKVLKEAKYYYMAAFFLTVSPETAVEVGKHAAAENKPFALNLAAPFLIQVPPFWVHVQKMIGFSDFVFGNEHEGEAIGVALGIDDPKNNLEAVAKAIVALPKENSERSRVVIITQGGEPAIVATTAGVTLSAPNKCDNVVDLNGAGDSFVGGFLSQLIQDKPIEQCLAGGHYAANLVIQRSGCTYPEKAEFVYTE
eukprot:TRINITY_DN4431_c0_g4_i2.p1 TRINITY_DN4431_c0_g4~~TRINITY_DN4431_c0_g4_i2.p1  ORF type:complete len:383 (+),score=115.12 TRINITY_DN4431_c0_g4_i2:101-1150(+)